MLRYLSAGESHGRCLTAIIEGLPAGLPLELEQIDRELARRQRGCGRGPRMQLEQDRVQVLAGLRDGKTLGSPLALIIENKDWPNWAKVMDPISVSAGEPITNPRPGHADLPGILKYRQRDVRPILERASARETAMRVAVGAVAKALLAVFQVQIVSHVVAIGEITAASASESWGEISRIADESPVRCLDREAEQAMVAAINAAQKEGDSLGGIFEVIVLGVPWGLGSHVHWDRKIDGRLAGAVVSIQGVKGVEFGAGFAGTRLPGSKFHDQIVPGPEGGFGFTSNNAGGIQGGMTTAAPLVLRGAMKPLPTLAKPLQTVDIRSKEATTATVQRTDSCAVPAASIVAEAAVAWELALAFTEKFGGDSLAEIRENHIQYLRVLAEG